MLNNLTNMFDIMCDVLNKNSKIIITGGSGFVGMHVVKILRKKGYTNLIIPRSKDYDLRNPKACQALLTKNAIVIHLAANVGGIGYNNNFPANLFYDNALMGIHMLHESYMAHVKKFIAVSTVCAYPKFTSIPFKEENLWEGYPEETNAAYGMAKKILLVAAQAYKKQHNFNAIYLIPVNIYGPGDNFDINQSHVIPALIRKLYYAKIKKHNQVSVWGTGSASREFIYIEDAASAIVKATENYNKPDPINIGSGKEITIKDLVTKIATIVKYRGIIVWDKTKPDGQPRRLLNTEKAAREFGFKAQTDFDDGLTHTVKWYIKMYGKQLS